VEFNLDAQLFQLGLTAVDLEALTGASRTTVWRWRNGNPQVPLYVETILRQLQTIRAMASDIAGILSMSKG
jgi:hypothetical protein